MAMTLQAEARTATAGKTTPRVGQVLTTLAVLFLLFDGAAKVAMLEPVRTASAQLDVPERVIPGLGVVLITATLIYAFPRTALLGAILLTGYLGGATWTHVRMGGPIFPMAFPSLFTVLIWVGLYLREPRLRALLPLRG